LLSGVKGVIGHWISPCGTCFMGRFADIVAPCFFFFWWPRRGFIARPEGRGDELAPTLC
jgi:hypothetical protein